MGKVNIDFAALKKRLENPKIKWVAMSGLYVEVLEERHVRLVLPLKDLHVNHVGTAYAGSIFMIAEMSMAALVYCTYGNEKYIPIVSRFEVDYLKPAKTDLVVDVRLTEEEAAEKIKPIEERGKGRMTLILPIADSEGEEIARATATVYLLPAGGDLAKK